jgi:hypothetical protein
MVRANGRSRASPLVKYMLVLQWAGSSLSDYDAMTKLEDAVESSLTGGAKVDGHDIGSGEMNIFVETNDPAKTFAEVEAAMRLSPLWNGMHAAYRKTDGGEYIVVRPPGLRTFQVT